MPSSPSRFVTLYIMDIASSSRTPVNNSSKRDTRTPSSSSTPSVDGARMMMSLLLPELNNTKPSLTTVPLTKSTSSSLSGLPPCSTVVPPKFYGTLPPELDVVSPTSSLEETPLVSVTPLSPKLTYTMDGTDKSSLSTPRDSSVELRFTPSKLLLLTLPTIPWNSSTLRLLTPKISNSFLDLKCVSSVLLNKTHQRAS